MTVITLASGYHDVIGSAARRVDMFGKKGKQQPGIQTYFGSSGSSATVFNSGSSMFTVSGSNGHDGTYFQTGNMISGPDGIHTVMGEGPVKTVFGPNGETHTIIENGFGGTVL